jgi:hypothetical protein
MKNGEKYFVPCSSSFSRYFIKHPPYFIKIKKLFRRDPNIEALGLLDDGKQILN